MEMLIAIYGTFAVVGISVLWFLNTDSGERWMNSL